MTMTDDNNKTVEEIDRYAKSLLGRLTAGDIHSVSIAAGEAWSRFCLVSNVGRELPPHESVRDALLAVQARAAEALDKLPKLSTPGPAKRVRREAGQAPVAETAEAAALKAREDKAKMVTAATAAGLGGGGTEEVGGDGKKRKVPPAFPSARVTQTSPSPKKTHAAQTNATTARDPQAETFDSPRPSRVRSRQEFELDEDANGGACDIGGSSKGSSAKVEDILPPVGKRRKVRVREAAAVTAEASAGVAGATRTGDNSTRKQKRSDDEEGDQDERLSKASRCNMDMDVTDSLLDP